MKIEPSEFGFTGCVLSMYMNHLLVLTLSLWYTYLASSLSLCTRFLIWLILQPSNGKDLDLEFSLEDLETIKVIGKGSGGMVQLVRHKWIGKLFALKVVAPYIRSFVNTLN